MEIMRWFREKGSHPNIIQMIGAYQKDKYSYIILERAAQGNVFSYLKKNPKKIDIKVKLNWLLQIA